jgi:pimeloyl-ACP methyl ester carboxylesterase
VARTSTRIPGFGLSLLVHSWRDPRATPSGLTVLLVHGFMDAGSTWDMVAEPLAEAGHQVVAPDLRGFGGSDPVGAGGYYHFPDYIADLAFLVDRLAPERLALVGHSMGGTASCLFAGTFPERVERLAILEGLGTLAGEPEFAIDRMLTWVRQVREDRAPRPLASVDDAIARLGANHPRVPKEVLATRVPMLTRTDGEGRIYWAFDPLHRTRSPTPFVLDNFKAFLRRIQCPTLFVGGGSTGWHPPDEAERLACLADVSTFELPEAGHMMHWTAAAPLAARLVEFLAEPPAKPSLDR